MKKIYQSRINVQYSESESDQYDEDEYYHNKNKNKGNYWPRFVKNDMDLIDQDNIVINTSKTQYQVVQQVAEQLGWSVQTSKKSQKWDIMWIDSHIQAHDLFKLHQHQKISHFPAIYVLTKKNFLGRSLMKMNRAFPDKYNFFPNTWSIPADLTDLMRQDEKREKNGEDQQYYIFKPEAMAQGKGIKIYSSIDKLKNKNGIVQDYVNNPLLVQGLKFDLRIYVLILGYNPLRIFIYDQGLARFATQKYRKVGKKNVKDVYMHLTNYAINKNSKNFIFNKSDKDMDKGHKRSLTAIYNYLESKGIDSKQLKRKIDQMIIKTLIVGQPMIAHTYSLAQADTNYNDICFQILGFDVLINDQLEPILLQVNHTPSFKTQTPLDKAIKKKLIKDTLLLLDVNVQNKKQKINKKRQFLEMRSQRKLIKLSNQEKQALRKKKWQQRQEYQQKNLGNFRKIFPIKKEISKYRQLIQYANKIFNDHNGFKNKQTQKIYQGSSNRPKSFQISNPDLASLPSPVKSKYKDIKRYNKTAIVNHDKLQKFPSITMQLRKSEQAINQSNKESNIQQSTSQKTQSMSQNLQCFSPIKRIIIDQPDIDIGTIQNQLTNPNKGSFLSPKIIDLNSLKKSTKSQTVSPIKNRQNFTQSLLQVNKFSPKKHKLDEISAQTTKNLRKLPNKIYNYSDIISLNEPNKIILSPNLSETLKSSKKYKLPFLATEKQSSNLKLKPIQQK